MATAAITGEHRSEVERALDLFQLQFDLLPLDRYLALDLLFPSVHPI